eukprot:876944-Rhodomonas_salina.2
MVSLGHWVCMSSAYQYTGTGIPSTRSVLDSGSNTEGVAKGQSARHWCTLSPVESECLAIPAERKNGWSEDLEGHSTKAPRVATNSKAIVGLLSCVGVSQGIELSVAQSSQFISAALEDQQEEQTILLSHSS